MANTHRAVIEHLDNSVELIAAGPQVFCEEQLAEWIADHPLDEYDVPLVLEIALPARPELLHDQTIAYFDRLQTENNK